MMASALAAAVIAVIAAGYILARLHAWLAAHWFLVHAWRWFSGNTWHGQPVTDAGWLRPGQRALTTTGHATRWHHLPRLHRAVVRTGGTLALLLLTWGFLAAPLVTLAVLAALALAGVTVAVLLAMRIARAWKDRRTWLHPLHLAAHQLAGHPRATLASSWIKDLATDDAGAITGVTLELPPGWPADPKDQERLVGITSAKLAIESPEVSKRLAGPRPQLMLTRSQPPPGLIGYGDVAEAVERADSNDLICGIGKKGAIVRASLSLDSPHFGVNMGSGAGKSNLAAFWLLQELRRGAIAMVLDAKYFSHPWLIKDAAGEYAQLPNVAYLSSPAELHAGMLWLAAELGRRTRVAQRAVTASGRLRGDVGPRIIVIAEELNMAMPQVKQHWADIRTSDDVKKSPALTGLGAVAFAGRALKMHLMLIGQMLTADVTGGKDSSVKQNVGVWAMARYGAAGWRTAVGDIPMPPSPDVPGRIQLVMARGVREVQTPLIDLEQARELAMAGIVTPCPAGMPGAVTVTGQQSLPSGPDQQVVTVTTPPAVSGPRLVDLAEAVRLRVVHRDTTLYALRMARHRDKDFPASLDKRGTAKLYDAAELAKWDAGRRG
jgi:hypothetical protein